MSILTIRGLNKFWGDAHVVRDLNLETREGEFIALLGPSGCGKSTTLRLIAGLEDASSGEILLDGKPITNLPSAKRGIAMVFQSYALFPHLTVADNITFGLSVRGETRKAQAEKLGRVAPLLGLKDLLDRRPSQLSGGQQQRVALGRALIAEAPVCLLDEPLSNLDASLRAEMRNEIRSLQRRLGITMIFVTHDQTEAMSMADRVILMREGRVEQAGTPAELYEQPASTFVAGFIGTPPMNVLDLAATESGAVIAGGCGQPVAAVAGADLLLGVRPEHVQISDSGHAAVVETTEYFGADSVVVCRIGAQSVTVRIPGRPGLGPGTPVHLRWPDSAIHLFDKTTGQRRRAH